MEARDTIQHPTVHRMAPKTESDPAPDVSWARVRTSSTASPCLGAWNLAPLGEGLCPFCLESQGGQGSPGNVNSTVASVMGGMGPGPTLLSRLGTCSPS